MGGFGISLPLSLLSLFWGTVVAADGAPPSPPPSTCHLVLVTQSDASMESCGRSYSDSTLRNHSQWMTVWTDKSWEDTTTAFAAEKEVASQVASTWLAMEHLRNRDGSVVIPVQDACVMNWTWSVVVADTPAMAARGILLEYDRLIIEKATDTCHVKAEVEEEESLAVGDIDFCMAVVGPFSRGFIEDVHILSESLLIPQLTVGVLHLQEERKKKAFSSRNNYVSSTSVASSAIAYWNSQGKHRPYVVLLYDFAGFDTLLAQWQARQHDIKMEPIPLKVVDDEGRAVVCSEKDLRDRVEEAMIRVKELGYRTVVVVTESATLVDILATEARKQDLVGNDFVWTFLFDFHFARPEQGSDLYQLLKGSGLMLPLDGFSWKGKQDAFWRSWEQHANASSTMTTSAMSEPSYRSSFVYDAVVNLGLSVCRDEGPQQFQGASGWNEFDEDGNRVDSSVVFGMYNVRPSDDGGLEKVLTALLINDKWEPFVSKDDGTEPQFVFFGGSTKEPWPIRDEGNPSYIGPGIRAMGLTFMVFSLLLSCGAAVWVAWNRKESLVKAGQPEFLYLVCCGAILIALSVYPMSLDERFHSVRELNFACRTTPWLFILGNIIVDCSLLCKLWRINKVFQFKRRGVSFASVLGPFAVFLIPSVALLLWWTISDPVRWERRKVSDIPLVTSGSCTDKDSLRFFPPLMVLAVLPTLLTAIMAWKTKDIPGEYSQTTWIFKALMAKMQVWVVGIPCFVIVGTYNPEVYFMGYTVIVLPFALLVVSLVIGPMVYMVRLESLSAKEKPRVRTLDRSSGGSPQLLGRGGVRVSGIATPESAGAVHRPSVLAQLSDKNEGFVADVEKRLAPILSSRRLSLPDESSKRTGGGAEMSGAAAGADCVDVLQEKEDALQEAMLMIDELRKELERTKANRILTSSSSSSSLSSSAAAAAAAASPWT